MDKVLSFIANRLDLREVFAYCSRLNVRRIIYDIHFALGSSKGVSLKTTELI